MSVINTLSDTYIRIKNGYILNSKFVWVIKSKQVVNILSILYLEGFIRSYSFDSNQPNKIKVDLKYSSDGQGAVRNIKGISKSSRRVYTSNKTLWGLCSKNSLGCFILSTSKGVMSSKEALKINVGGELLCYVC